MSSRESRRGAYFALTRNNNEVVTAMLAEGAVSSADRPLPISERQAVGFSLTPRTPELEYGVSVGEVRLPAGRVYGPSIYWEDGQHFESARGRVRVHLSTRAGAHASWRVCARLDVNVVPTKLGELRYETLLNDIRETAAGLIFDIVSKMLRGVRYTRGMTQVASHTSHLELANLRHQWRGISRALDLITAEPQLRTARCIELRSYTGTGVLSPNTAVRLAARGFDPRSPDRGRQITVPAERLTRTGDIVEHRVILWFLQLLLLRVQECTEAALAEIALIESERDLRDVTMGAGPTLYEEVDLPKIERLRESIAQAHDLAAQVRRATLSPLFRDLRPQAGTTDTPVFQHVDAYHRFGRRMRHYLTASLVALEAGSASGSRRPADSTNTGCFCGWRRRSERVDSAETMWKALFGAVDGIDSCWILTMTWSSCFASTPAASSACGTNRGSCPQRRHASGEIRCAGEQVTRLPRGSPTYWWSSSTVAR